MRVRLLPRADLSTLCCDAIATSANAGLVGNANPAFWRFAGRRNADGAVHRAAGPELAHACAELAAVEAGSGARCRVGEGVVTPGIFGRLRTDAVLHAVAPDGAYAVGLQRWMGSRRWSGGQNATAGTSGAVHLEEARPAGEARDILQATTAAILEAAESCSAGSVGIPAVGCGVLGWNPTVAAEVALRAMCAHFAARPDGKGSIERIDVALFSDAAFAAWSASFTEIIGPPSRQAGETPALAGGSNAGEAMGGGSEEYDLRRWLAAQ